MPIKLLNALALASLLVASSLTISAAESGSDAERIARLEKRLLEMEARLANTEQQTKEVKVLASSAAASGGNASVLGNQATFDILANSAWRNLRWTQEEQWAGVVRGLSEDKVVELLGSPPRSVKSLKPRVDLVYYYETSIRDRSNSLRGEISFKDGRVIAVKKPNFGVQQSAE